MGRPLGPVVLLAAIWASSSSSSSSQASSLQQAPLSPRIVETQYGSLRGIIDRFGNGIGLQPVEKFLGVPYATPPVNGLRFMPPITPSNWEGVRLADRPAPSCPQQQSPVAPPPAPLSATATDDQQQQQQQQQQRFKYLNTPAVFNTSEDCLYLNVFYPTFDGEFSKEKPPVVLLVEASSWEASGANWIDGSALASRGRLMVASVNFRLGILGFLKTSPKDSPQGNYGMLDVIAAVHWLRQNAAAFGGDAGRLTLIGIGHGAALVHLLMLSPVARGLFQGAILLGGSALGAAGLQPHPEDVRQQVAGLAGCWDANESSNANGADEAERYDLAPCLRKVPLDRLLDIGRLRTPRFLAAYAPFVDYAGYVRPYHDPAGFLRDLTRMKSEAFPKCDLMVGVATYELERDVAGAAVSEERRDSILRTLVRNVYYYHNSEIFAVLRNEYTDWEVGSRNNTEAVTHSLYEALSDGLVVSPLMELLRYHAGMGAGRTFFYHLNHPPSLATAAASSSSTGASNFETNKATVGQQQLGSFRADSVFYLLGLPLLADFRSSASALKAKQLADEVELAEQLVSYVAGFCYAGDPNEHGATEKNTGKASSGLIYWDQYTLAEQRYLSLGVKSKVKTHYRSHKMSVWLRLIPQLHQPGEEGVVLSHHYFRPKLQQQQQPQQSVDPPVFDEDYFDGIVRPYGRHMRAPGRSTTLPTPDDAAAAPDSNRHDKGPHQNTTECPTQQPYVATQLSNGNAVNSSGSPRRNESASHATNPNNSNNHHHNNNNNSNSNNSRTLDDAWPYTQMLVVVVATGVGLLFLNAIVVVCFFVVRRRRPGAEPTPPPRPPSSSSLEPYLSHNGKRAVANNSAPYFSPGKGEYALASASSADRLSDAPCGRHAAAASAASAAPNRVESVSSIIDLTCPHLKRTPTSGSVAQVEHFATGADVVVVGVGGGGQEPALPFDDDQSRHSTLCNNRHGHGHHHQQQQLQQVDNAIELYDCYTCERHGPFKQQQQHHHHHHQQQQSPARESFSANHNEITV